MGGHDISIKQWLHFFNHSTGNVALFGGGWHDTTAVLCANVVALAIELCRIMNGEKDLKQRFKRDDGWVKNDLDNFCMPCRS